MKLKEYVRDHLFAFCLRICVITFIIILLKMLHVGAYSRGFITVLLLGSEVVIFLQDYLRRHHFYRLVRRQHESIDKKYLLSAVLERPNFYEGIFLYDLFRETSKSMNDYIALYKRSSKAYREYIETWVHEVKTPIAASQLILVNHPSEISDSLREELDRIQDFVEQALYYSRSNQVEKDYLIQETRLEDVVKTVVKKHSKLLIESKIAVHFENLEQTVYTDRKWVEFIVGQIVSNAIKYRRDLPEITFSAYELGNRVILQIRDNGIGMCEKDVTKAFEKGFTGQNGRRFTKATGMGLYLCDKLCAKLGLQLGLTSIEGKETKVSITFPKSRMHLIEDVAK